MQYYIFGNVIKKLHFTILIIHLYDLQCNINQMRTLSYKHGHIYIYPVAGVSANLHKGTIAHLIKHKFFLILILIYFNILNSYIYNIYSDIYTVRSRSFVAAQI